MISKSASRKSQASSEGASEEDFSFAWNRLLDEIADDAQRTESYTGRASFKVSVMQALADVPREAFIPDDSRHKADDNRPFPIGQRQTISQPYIVALMTELLNLKPDDRVLEIGTGCGYQTAVLAALTSEIFSVEYLGGPASVRESPSRRSRLPERLVPPRRRLARLARACAL